MAAAPAEGPHLASTPSVRPFTERSGGRSPEDGNGMQSDDEIAELNLTRETVVETSRRIDIHPDRIEQLEACLALTIDEALRSELHVPWHWIYLPDHVPYDRLAPDGLPPEPTVGPDCGQRLWGGCQIDVEGTLEVGERADYRREVRSLPLRTASGPIWLVETRSQLTQGSAARLVESQRVIHRPRRLEDGPPDDARPARRSSNALWTWVHRITAVQAFLFAGLTNNAHRIHYDWQYAVDEEGWPGLVVNGHLLVMLACELARRETSRPIVSAVAVARRPVFVDEELTFEGAFDRSGRLIVQVLTPTELLAASVIISLCSQEGPS